MKIEEEASAGGDKVNARVTFPERPCSNISYELDYWTIRPRTRRVKADIPPKESSVIVTLPRGVDALFEGFVICEDSDKKGREVLEASLLVPSDRELPVPYDKNDTF